MKDEVLYNVYAWRKNGPAIRVMEGVGVLQAADCVDIYLKRGIAWDAYMVEQADDPGWIAE